MFSILAQGLVALSLGAVSLGRGLLSGAWSLSCVWSLLQAQSLSPSPVYPAQAWSPC
jgi:hypothetical protein